jgi:hypothetical protein
MVIYFGYLHFSVVPDMLKNGKRSPVLPAVIVYTIGLFAFGESKTTHSPPLFPLSELTAKCTVQAGEQILTYTGSQAY